MVAARPAAAIDLDGVLGDTRGLWQAFLEDAARRFATIAPLDPAALPADRGAAAAELDCWAQAGVGDWRAQLGRFADDHAPVHLRPRSDATAALRSLAGAGWLVGAYTDAPDSLAQVALAHLGAARRVEIVECGVGARERLLARLGDEARLATTPGELATILGDARAA